MADLEGHLREIKSSYVDDPEMIASELAETSLALLGAVRAARDLEREVYGMKEAERRQAPERSP